MFEPKDPLTVHAMEGHVKVSRLPRVLTAHTSVHVAVYRILRLRFY